MTTKKANRKPARHRAGAESEARPPGQIVLVFQGGGALGAYQAGLYQALHEAGIEPDWVIGTSIGAVNAAIIAGNEPAQRLERLTGFWQAMQSGTARSVGPLGTLPGPYGLAGVVAGGIEGFFRPNLMTWLAPQLAVGVDKAAYYSTEPLRATLEALVEFKRIGDFGARITVGAVNVTSGAMRYFDSRRERLGAEHIMASGALPPGFPAVRVDGEPYWDGGIYSNTPIEAVLEDNPRRNSTIFAVQLWRPDGTEPATLWDVLGRHKDIQYSSRAQAHLAWEQQSHRLRHVISELGARLPARSRATPEVLELLAWGCRTTMHFVRLVAPRLAADDVTKDIDFSPEGVATRWQAGLDDGREVLRAAPWSALVDPIEGVIVHDFAAHR